MSNESITPEEAARAIEYPDRVGFVPHNPYLANFRPYIPASVRLRELTIIPLIMGTLLGMVFGASSLYLVLKVGLTVSASIPVAVISITLFRVFSKVGLRYATILENNIVHTAGSAVESIAFGVGVTMPAIMILGLDLEVTRVMLVAMLGGLLGILMMIPLRRALIVAQHGQLKYPEGTACAEVLKAGASDESRAAAHQGGTVASESEQMGAKTIFAGLGVGFLYQVLMAGFKGWKDTPEKVFGAPFKAGSIAAGGIISLFRSLPTIWHGLKGGLADLRGGQAASANAPRTDQDLSMKVVIGGIIALVALIMLFPQLNLRWNLIGALLIVAFGFLFVTVSSRLTGEIGSSSNPISGMTVATLLLTCLAFLIIGWTAPPYFVTALSIGGIVCIAASNGGTTSQDLKTGFLVGSTPKSQQIAILFGALASALTLGYVLLFLNNAYTVYVPMPATSELRAPSGELGRAEKLRGLQGLSDEHTYRALERADPAGGPAQRYLVNDKGVPIYLVDPGINGTHKVRPDGSTVTKFDAPKATLMSYIIKGILSRKLPWALVLLGVMIAIVLEMSGIPSLAFAVVVYLPLASSSPIFIGGMIRLLVDRYLRVKFRHKNLSDVELTAEGDKSPGVLLASGYIADGAITGIVIAAKELVAPLAAMGHRIDEWQTTHNPFFNGPNSDLLALIPFIILCVLLYLVGRDVVLRPRSRSGRA